MLVLPNMNFGFATGRFRFITSFCGHLLRYHKRMASIESQIVEVLVDRVLSGGSLNWAQVRRRNHPIKTSIVFSNNLDFQSFIFKLQ